MSDIADFIDNEALVDVIDHSPEFIKMSLGEIISLEGQKNSNGIESDKARILSVCSEIGEDKCFAIRHCVSPFGSGYFRIGTEKLLSGGEDVVRYVDSAYAIESIGPVWSVYSWLKACVYDELLHTYLSWLAECVMKKNPGILFSIKRLYYPFVIKDIPVDSVEDASLREFVENIVRPYVANYTEAQAKHYTDADKYADWRTYYNGGSQVHDAADDILLDAKAKIAGARVMFEKCGEWERAENKILQLEKLLRTG